MEIVFNTTTVPCCRELFHQTRIIREHAECVVSDVKEDIGKIAWAEAQLYLKGKEAGESSTVIEAEAEITVFYLTEDRASLCSMKLDKDFTISFDGCGEADAESQVSLILQGVQARAVNPRKLSVELTVRAELCCYVRESVVSGVAAGGESLSELQLLRERSECEILSQICEKSFVVSEQIPVSQPEAESLLLSHVELQMRDTQMIGGKALVKGGASFRFVLASDEKGSPVFQEMCLPFSVLIDSGDEESTLGEMKLEPTALYASLSDAINGGRVIELELHAVAQAVFSRKIPLDYIVDAYSTRCPSVCSRDSVSLCLGRSVTELACRSSEPISLSEPDASVAAQHADILSYSVTDRTASASVSVSLLLRGEDGTFDSTQKLFSFETQLPETDCEIASVWITSLFTQNEGDAIRIEAEICFAVKTQERTERSYLCSIELDTDASISRDETPSLYAVRSRGRSLWEIAKEHHSSMEAIERLNEKYPMSSDMLLVPRI